MSLYTERFLTSSANVPAVPKYFVVKRKEGEFAKASPFLVTKKKTITGCFRLAVQEIRKAEGGLLVKTLTDQQSSRLLELQNIGDIDIIVVPHTTLITTTGVVVCRDLLNRTEAVSYTHLDVYKRQI